MNAPRALAPAITHDTGFVEVADRCWMARYEFLDVNVGVVAGDRGLLVIDTSASEVDARRVLEQARRLGAGEVVAVLNTHQHFDHCFGNVVFSEAYDGVPIHAHENAVSGLRVSGPAFQEQAARDAQGGPGRERSAHIAETRILVPDHPFSSARAIDLGDRFVEVLHPGRGHTAGDAVARVPDVDLMFAGDLVEESRIRNGAPGFGDDCFPLEWAATLDLMISMLTASSTVVPGHGMPVDKDFVTEQRGSIGMVAETIRSLAGQGVPVEEALATGEWPYPVEELRHAVERGYVQLPPGGRSLPML